MAKHLDHWTPKWRRALAAKGFSTFEDFWKEGLVYDWVDDENDRSKGWSRVARCQLVGDNGEETTVFIKLQKGKKVRSLSHLSGEIMIQRERRIIEELRDKDVCVPDVVYFGLRPDPEGLCSVLILEDLADHEGLDAVLDKWQEPNRSQKTALICRIAESLKNLHELGYCHGSMYPKHIFVPKVNQDLPIAFIDFEKTRRKLSRRKARDRDFDSLNRRTPFWAFSTTDRLRFLHHYFASTERSEDLKGLFSFLSTRLKKRHSATLAKPENAAP